MSSTNKANNKFDNKVTLFIVGGEEGGVRKYVVPSSSLKVLAFIGAILVLISVAVLADYFGLLLQSMENKRLKAENMQLVKQFEIVEGKVVSLEDSLERVKTFTTKLKLITNVESDDRITKSLMSPKPAPGGQIEEYEPMDQRSTPQEMVNQDQFFDFKKPLNESTGDMSVETSKQDYGSLVVRIDKAVKDTSLKEQSVIELWESLSERQSLLNATPSIRPTKGWLTSKFGYRFSPFSNKIGMHAGLDIASSPGSPVYAPADGVVSFAAFDSSYGKLVSIDHGYGVITRYGHCSQIYVQVGQKVSKWDVIAAVGNTGRSTGPHLHYEVRINGIPVDPINYVLDE